MLVVEVGGKSVEDTTLGNQCLEQNLGLHDVEDTEKLQHHLLPRVRHGEIAVLWRHDSQTFLVLGVLPVIQARELSFGMNMVFSVLPGVKMETVTEVMITTCTCNRIRQGKGRRESCWCQGLSSPVSLRMV